MSNFILMGDIIKSSDKNQKELMIDFKKVVEETNQYFKKLILSPLTITLGDEFQGVINNHETATMIIIYIEEKIIQYKMNFKLRYILHQGDIDTPINSKNSYEMLGEGLTLARKKLTQLKNEKTRFSFSIKNEKINYILNEAFIIYGNIIDKWNHIQDFEIAYSFIKLDDYKLVAKELNKNRSLIWKREKTLNILNYKSIKNIIIFSLKI